MFIALIWKLYFNLGFWIAYNTELNCFLAVGKIWMNYRNVHFCKWKIFSSQQNHIYIIYLSFYSMQSTHQRTSKITNQPTKYLDNVVPLSVHTVSSWKYNQYNLASRLLWFSAMSCLVSSRISLGSLSFHIFATPSIILFIDLHSSLKRNVSSQNSLKIWKFWEERNNVVVGVIFPYDDRQE